MPDRTDIFFPRQTNTGLFVQMRQSGSSAADIGRVQSAYRLASRLFNGRYRKTERAFICHAVGAASAILRFDARLDHVLAALLHATYDSGQFPDGRIGGATPGHRRWIKARVGADVESILYRYAQFEFGRGIPERICAEGFDEGDSDLLLIALAHEVDDMADAGLMFAPKYGRTIESRVEACAVLAEQIDRPEMADTLRAHGRLYDDVEWIDEFSSKTLHGFHIVPGVMAYLRFRFNHLRRKFVKVH